MSLSRLLPSPLMKWLRTTNLYFNYRRFRSWLGHPKEYQRFWREFKAYNELNNINGQRGFTAEYFHIAPCFDWDKTACFIDYYFWQDLWAAKKIFQAKPAEHFDVASRVDGFVAHVLSFMPVTLIDIRPLPWKIDNLNFIQADATNLETIADDSLESLSSLCAIEHFGLGRYGDPLDPEACFKAMKSLQRVLSRGGHLYLAVPIGNTDAVAFNAHRIFSVRTILDTLNLLTLEDFAVIDTRDLSKVRYEEHIDPLAQDIETDYAALVIGLFDFTKP